MKATQDNTLTVRQMQTPIGPPFECRWGLMGARQTLRVWSREQARKLAGDQLLAYIAWPGGRTVPTLHAK